MSTYFSNRAIAQLLYIFSSTNDYEKWKRYQDFLRSAVVAVYHLVSFVVSKFYGSLNLESIFSVFLIFEERIASVTAWWIAKIRKKIIFYSTNFFFSITYTITLGKCHFLRKNHRHRSTTITTKVQQPRTMPIFYRQRHHNYRWHTILLRKKCHNHKSIRAYWSRSSCFTVNWPMAVRPDWYRALAVSRNSTKKLPNAMIFQWMR